MISPSINKLFSFPLKLLVSPLQVNNVVDQFYGFADGLSNESSEIRDRNLD